MFEYLKGTFVAKHPDFIVLEVGGIGYKIFTSSAEETIPAEINQELLVYISAIYREDSQKLFGFFDQKTRDLFNRIADVSGIGPKIAMGIVSFFGYHDLLLAIHASDITKLSKAPGIGKKTAQRLILDLKDKLPEEPSSSYPTKASETTTIQDGINALVNLGYSYSQARDAIHSASAGGAKVSLNVLITSALKKVQR